MVVMMCKEEINTIGVNALPKSYHLHKIKKGRPLTDGMSPNVMTFADLKRQHNMEMLLLGLQVEM